MIRLVFGRGATLTSLVGINVGADNIARAKLIEWVGSSLAAALSGSVGIFLALFPNLWVSVFTMGPATFEAAKLYIQIVGPCFAFQVLGLSLYFTSQGAGAVTWPIIGTIVRVVVAVVGALNLAFELELGLQGVYFVAAAGMILFDCIIGIALKLRMWRR